MSIHVDYTYDLLIVGAGLFGATFARLATDTCYKCLVIDRRPPPLTVITREYSQPYTPGAEPYYPVNDQTNNSLYAKYKILADQEPYTIFGGRLAEYQYYNMDQAIASAMRKWGEYLSC